MARPRTGESASIATRDELLMPHPTRPFLVLYIVWHPDFPAGASMAEGLRDHFRPKLYENVAGGTGLSVIFRSEPVPDSSTPLPIDLDDSETSAIVVLCDQDMKDDAAWLRYARNLAAQTDEAGL